MREFWRGALHALALGGGVAASNLVNLGQQTTQLIHNPTLAIFSATILNGIAHWLSDFLTRSKLNP